MASIPISVLGIVEDARPANNRTEARKEAISGARAPSERRRSSLRKAKRAPNCPTFSNSLAVADCARTCCPANSRRRANSLRRRSESVRLFRHLLFANHMLTGFRDPQLGNVHGNVYKD